MGTTREIVQANIKKLVDSEGGPKAFADKVGVTKQAVNNWINSSHIPDIEKIAEIAHIYSVPLSNILTSSDETHPLDTSPAFVDVPLYGSIAAGTPIEMVEVDDTHPVPVKVMEQYPDAFLLRVKGESMNRVLPNGCFALIDPCDTVDYDGKPYAICVNGYDAAIKRVRKLANGFELVPDSTDPTYKPKVYDYGVPDTERITVIGRVVYHVLPFDWSY